ncbi:hypothetical protein [Silvibacterium sp.]|uniref:hypothetical protein n=1 Tax=Silvibacterium sp. TaxID=1964179 RepID=UPI0039E2BF9D
MVVVIVLREEKIAFIDIRIHPEKILPHHASDPFGISPYFSGFQGTFVILKSVWLILGQPVYGVKLWRLRA